jgi:hypothetical protein
MAFVASTTFTAAFLEIQNTYLPWAKSTQIAEASRGWLNMGLTLFLLGCVVVIVASAMRRWYVVMSGNPAAPGA